jgi:hypothetical protein
MSTLLVSSIQHPSAESPAIELDPVDGVVFSAASFDASAITSGTLDAARVPLAAGIGSNVVVASTTTNTTIGSSTFVDLTGLSATITPSSESSKILVLVSCQVDVNTNSTDTIRANVRIVRDSTAVQTFDWFAAKQRGDTQITATHFVSYLDSPSTTSATVYKVQGSASRTNATFGSNSGRSTITLIEVAG